VRRAFQHEALLYTGDEEFVAGTTAFIRDGLAADEPVLVVVGAAKIELLRDALGRDRERVCFADMADVGRNPARIIPAWRVFVDEQLAGGRPGRGIGEPIWVGRRAAELVECQRHEELLNLAFADSQAWSLLCPYDTEQLAPAVVEEARRSHPTMVEAGARYGSHLYRGLDRIGAPFAAPLPPPLPGAQVLRLADGLDAVCGFVGAAATRAGLPASRSDQLVLAVHEVAASSLRDSGAGGSLRLWCEGRTLLCELSDASRIDDPLAGRYRPDDREAATFGLWLANQLCDLVQVRSLPTGSVVRLHVRLPDDPITFLAPERARIAVDGRAAREAADRLWDAAVSTPGALLAAAKITEALRHHRTTHGVVVDFDEREAVAVERALAGLEHFR
jgi:hypothetical protein